MPSGAKKRSVRECLGRYRAVGAGGAGGLGAGVLLGRGTPPGLTWGSRDQTPQVSRGLPFAEKDDQCLASFLNAV